MPEPKRHVVFFDHDCLLCNGTVKFLMARDKHDVLRFAPLQGTTAASLFSRQSDAAQDPEALTSIVVAIDHGTTEEKVLMRSTAVGKVLGKIGGFWPVLGKLLLFIPRPLRDWGYGIVSKYRYRWFGKATPESCPLPTPEVARKLLP